MKYAYLFLLFIIPVQLVGQFRVSGVVTSAKDGQPLQGASVFCQNTTLGTVSGTDGKFYLTLPAGGYDLIVSYSGFETQSIRISGQNNLVETPAFQMKEKEKSLEEVAVVVTTEVRNGWEKYGEFFLSQFLGLTENSRECKIENPQVLRFFFSKKKNRLRVITDSTLYISNHALGYRIQYQLDSFIHEYGTLITQFTGYPLFEEMEGTPEQKTRWKEEREEAYLGSVTHFFRSYRQKNLDDAGYKLEYLDSTGNYLPIKDPYDKEFSEMDSSLLWIYPPGRLRVAYMDEYPEPEYLTKNNLSRQTTIQISQVDFLEGISVEPNGYAYDRHDIILLGYWAWEKLADFLPYDYSPEDAP